MLASRRRRCLSGGRQSADAPAAARADPSD